MTADLSFITEVEDAISNGSRDRRRDMLRHVTDLFIVGAAQYSDEDVALYDDVIIRLAVDIEVSARALLAVRLASIPNAPPNIMRSLASDDINDVAGPVLAQSERLDDTTLVETASKKGQEHLLAISRRRCLSETVTDVLVERGDPQVVLSTAENRGAKFSETGFAKLVERSDGDDRLAECVGLRPDLPPRLFLKLLAKASQAVRTKLEAAHPNAGREVHQAVDEVTSRIRAEMLAASPDYAAARAGVKFLHQSGLLDDSKLGSFAQAGRFEEIAVALALLSDVPIQFIERALLQEAPDTLLILARSLGLSWPTVKAILVMRGGKRFVSRGEIAHCLASFERLKHATAQEIVRFYRAREQTAAKLFA